MKEHIIRVAIREGMMKYDVVIYDNNLYLNSSTILKLDKKFTSKHYLISSIMKMFKSLYGNIFLLDSNSNEWWSFHKDVDDVMIITGYLVKPHVLKSTSSKIVCNAEVRCKVIIELPILSTSDFKFLVKKHNKYMNNIFRKDEYLIYNRKFHIVQNLNKNVCKDYFLKRREYLK